MVRGGNKTSLKDFDNLEKISQGSEKISYLIKTRRNWLNSTIYGRKHQERIIIDLIEEDDKVHLGEFVIRVIRALVLPKKKFQLRPKILHQLVSIRKSLFQSRKLYLLEHLRAIILVEKLVL